MTTEERTEAVNGILAKVREIMAEFEERVLAILEENKGVPEEDRKA